MDRHADDTQQLRPHWRRRLGEMLVGQGILTSEQLAAVLERQKREPGTRLGHLLIDLGYATPAQIAGVMAEQLHIPAVDLERVELDAETLAVLPPPLARAHLCLPWRVEEREIYLIMADATDLVAADAVAFHTGLRVKPVVAPEPDVLVALDRFYPSPAAPGEAGQADLTQQLASVAAHDTVAGDDTAEAVAALVQFVDTLLADAIRAGASSLHFEPQEKGVTLRYRVDGVLRPIITLSRRVYARVLARIRTLCHIEFAGGRREPQEGRAFIRHANCNYRLRVDTLSTTEGEQCLVRVLPQTLTPPTLAALDLDTVLLGALSLALQQRQGVVLFAGPDGSGRSTTLAAALGALAEPGRSIVTVEGVPASRIPGVSQVVTPGLDGVAALRHALRQDPDVVMVGEISDLATARAVFDAAQAGRLMLSKLSASDAPAALLRLLVLGLGAAEIGASLLAVQAQRLVRRLCDCRAVRQDGTATPAGCSGCGFTGFRGRVGVFELMPITPAIRAALAGGGTVDAIRVAARAEGMRTLQEDGLGKVAAGLTTLSELQRVLGPDTTAATTAGDRAGEGRGKQILVADDDANLRTIIQEILEGEGYAVTTACDGQEALAQIHRSRPDLVLTDLRMPRMDGFELLKRLRADLSTCRIPVVFLSVVTDIEQELRALDFGADDYVGKPVERARLLGRVRHALFRSQLLRTATS